MAFEEVAKIVKDQPDIKSVLDAFNDKSPRIGLLDQKVASDAVTVISVKFMGLYFGSVKGKPDEEGMAVFAELLIEEYPHLKINEIKFVFKNAVKGRYGEHYNRIDIMTLMKWFKEYYSESRDEFAAIRERAHQVRKTSGPVLPSTNDGDLKLGVGSNMKKHLSDWKKFNENLENIPDSKKDMEV